jgi:uncharacterized protein (TIGR02246 family)
MMRAHLAGASLIQTILCVTVVRAQATPASVQRTEIQQVVRAYIDAHNKSDAATIADMYSREAGVTSVGDGQIMRGWDRIREAFDQLVGTEGKFRISIGSIDVVPMGSTYALALTNYTITLGTGAQETQQRGAMTLVFQKIQGEWKVIHDHTSTQTPTPDAAAVSAAPAQSPTTNQVQAAAAPPRGTRVTITDVQAVAIKAQGFVHYTFQLPAATCAVSGRISGISGGNKDFEAYIMDDDNFRNWSAGVSGARALWQSGRVVVTSIDATIAGPGAFHLVISNTWSIATDKTVQVQAAAQCGG